MDVVGTLARIVHVLLLGLWLGAGVMFAAIVAPDLFAVLETRHTAGLVITAILAHFDFFALLACPGILVTLVLGYLPLGARLRYRVVAVVLMTAAVALSGYWISPTMIVLRDAMGRATDDIPTTDPLKAEFLQLHTFSEALMVIHLLLALGLLVTAIISMTPRRKFGSIEF